MIQWRIQQRILEHVMIREQLIPLKQKYGEADHGGVQDTVFHSSVWVSVRYRIHFGCGIAETLDVSAGAFQ